MSTSEAPSRVHASAFGCITMPFLLLAIVPLAWGARSNWRAGDLARRGEVVEGRVVELRHVATNPTIGTGTQGRTHSSWSPVVRFVTRAGESRVTTGSVNRAPAPWRVGDAVAVVYDPTDAARADLQSEVRGWRLWFAVWCFVALLLVAIAMAPVVLWMREPRVPSA